MKRSLALLTLKRDGKFLPPRLLQLSINFVHTAVEHASTFKIVKAELGWLLFGLIFPLICFDDVLLGYIPVVVCPMPGRLHVVPCHEWLGLLRQRHARHGTHGAALA